MHRLLVKVGKKRLRRRYRDRNGLEYARYALEATVLGSAIGALKVPERHVGRRVRLVRDFLLPWGVKVGDLLVLDPLESARVLAGGPRPPAALGRCSDSGAPRRESGDVDRDGYAEDLLTNAFVRAVIQPHRGARVQSLCDCEGVDRLSQPFDYIMAGKYILLGGSEEYIAEGGSPGELWNAGFERTEPPAGPESVELRYAHAPKKPEGVELSKRIGVERDLPGVVQSYEVTYAGKRPDGDGRPVAEGGAQAGAGDAAERADEASVTLAIRMTTPSRGEIPSRNVFDVPGAAGLELVRYHRPASGRRWRWRDWRDEYFGLKAGFVVSRHEEDGAAMAVLFSPRTIAHVAIRRDFQGPELTIRHAPAMIPKGGRRRYGLTLLVGHAAAATADSMLLLTRGRAGQGGVPVAITLRTRRSVGQVRADLATAGGRRRPSLAPRGLPLVGRIHTAIVRLPRSAFPLSCSINVGGERLSARLEARS